MSRKLLEKLANEIENELEKNKNLRDDLNLLQHTIVITEARLSKAIFDELNFKSVNDKDQFPAWTSLSVEQRNKIVDIIKPTIKGAMKEIHEEALKLKQQTSSNDKITFLVSPKTFTENSTVIRATSIFPENSNFQRQNPYSKKTYDLNSFSAIRTIYSKATKKIFNAISEELKIIRNQKTNPIAGAKVALEHKEGVVEVKASKIANVINELTRASSLSSQKRTALIKEFGLKIALDYLSTEEKTTVDVGIGSYYKNAQQAGIKEGPLGKNLKNLVKDIRERLAKNDLKTFSGSDDRVTIEKKKIVKTFKKAKNSKTINTKLKLSKQKVKKDIKGKIKASNSVGNFKPKTQKTYPIPSSINLQSLIPFINAKLTETVIENMVYPKLQNRTGRFASSVKVLNVFETEKGFPSIGYTYQKNPYQIFEQGAGKTPWATDQRDPRKLIDQSIREIAKELIAGRFYTRRI